MASPRRCVPKMNSPRTCRIICISLAWLAGAAVEIADGSRPNIVLILADDLGWADVGCNGGDLVETPHIDELAGAGVRFTQAYAPSPVCSPTRAAILTGKAPARLHMTVWAEAANEGPSDRKLIQGKSLPDLPHTETTLAGRLKDAGYLTALVGKWHLGDADHSPETHGFDVNIGGTHWGASASFFWPYRGAGRFGPQFRYVPHLEFGRPGEYLTDRLTDEAIRVIQHADRRPFFLYLAHYAPHTPIEAKTDDARHFEHKLHAGLHHQNAVYAAMVKSLDESVGRVMACLRERRLDQSTIVIFASDNGGYVGVDRKSGQSVPVTDNYPLRSGKGSCYEGGLRVPLIVKWPGVTPSGAVCDEPVVLTDLFHTLVAATGFGGGPAAVADGVDLSPLLKDPSGTLSRDAIFFHFPHYYDTTTPVSALRARDWKLLEYLEDGRLELYHLAADPREKTDLAEQFPDRAAELRKQLQSWRTLMNASLPRSNPKYPTTQKTQGSARDEDPVVLLQREPR
jgi:arylsulfatase A